MKTKMSIVCCLSIFCLLLYGCTTTLIDPTDAPYYYSDNIPVDGTMTKETEDMLYEKTRVYLKETHPDFNPERDQTYFWTTAHNTNWCSFIFDKRDKGQGYEVSCEDGKYADNFNPQLFSMRQEMIAYMNELMPENTEYNEYVFLNPLGSCTEGFVSDLGVSRYPAIRYAVISKKINIREQLKIDRLVVLKAAELLKRFGTRLEHIHINYAELEDTSMENYLSILNHNHDFLKRNLDRSSTVWLLTPNTHFFEHKELEKMGLLEYHLYNPETPVYGSEDTYFKAFANFVETENEGNFRNKDKISILKEIQ